MKQFCGWRQWCSQSVSILCWPSNVLQFWSCLQPVGSGSIAQVYFAKLKETGEEVAVKVCHPKVQQRIAVDFYCIQVLAKLADRWAPWVRLPLELDYGLMGAFHLNFWEDQSTWGLTFTSFISMHLESSLGYSRNCHILSNDEDNETVPPMPNKCRCPKKASLFGIQFFFLLSWTPMLNGHPCLDLLSVCCS